MPSAGFEPATLNNRATADLRQRPHGHFNIILQKIYSTVGIVTTRTRIFLFFKLSRPFRGPTQPPTEWVPRVLCPEDKLAEA